MDAMQLPGFNDVGDLPVGVYPSTIADVISRFGVGTSRRQVLSLRLERVHRIVIGTGHLLRFVVFGSFVTSKPEPNDVDVFMIMDDNFDMGTVAGEAALLFDHSAAQLHFGCRVFWVRRIAAFGGEQVAIEDWQIKRDGNRRGIVEIIGR
jgi:Family of unknown function (DUF6932)